MNSPTYRIKPLVWERIGNGYVAYSPVGKYYASDCGGYYWISGTSLPSPGEMERKHDSLEAAKAACEQHYSERMMEGLEEVK